MKRIYSLLICSIYIFVVLVINTAIADSTMLVNSGELYIEKGKAYDINFNNYFNKDIVIEFDYDVTAVNWDGDCNIPFILLSGSTDVGRISIYSKDLSLLATRVEDGTIINTGAVSRKGTMYAEIDYDMQEIVFKNKGGNFKTETTLLKTSFKNDGSAGISGVRIGAGGNPGVKVCVKVYNRTSSTMQTIYKFNEAYTGELPTLFDFNGSSENIFLTNDPVNPEDTVVCVPKNSNFNLVIMPKDFGYEGYISVRQRVYAESDQGSISEIILGQLQEYKTGKTTPIINSSIKDKTLVVNGKDKRYLRNDDGFLNRWIDIQYIIDAKNNAVQVICDGVLVAGTDNGTIANDTRIDVDDIDFVNKLYSKNPFGNLYIDDVEVMCIDASDVNDYTSEEKEIYGREEYVKSDSQNTDAKMKFDLNAQTGKFSISFMMCMENNTSQTALSLFTSSGGEAARMYLNNDEKISHFTENEFQTHPQSSIDKEWFHIQCDVDMDSQKVKWYLNHRPLQIEPIGFTNLYDNAGSIDTFQISVNKGAYVYVSDFTVFSTIEGAYTVTSNQYKVDNEYNIIEGIHYGDTVQDVKSNINEFCEIIGTDGKTKSDEDYILAGDSAVFENTNMEKFYYAISITGGQIPTPESEHESNIYVSNNGNDTTATGSPDLPYKTLEKAVEKAKTCLFGCYK